LKARHRFVLWLVIQRSFGILTPHRAREGKYINYRITANNRWISAPGYHAVNWLKRSFQKQRDNDCCMADALAGCASCSISVKRQKCVNVSGMKDECPTMVLISRPHRGCPGIPSRFSVLSASLISTVIPSV